MARQERRFVTNGYRSALKLSKSYRFPPGFLTEMSAPPDAATLEQWRADAERGHASRCGALGRPWGTTRSPKTDACPAAHVCEVRQVNQDENRRQLCDSGLALAPRHNQHGPYCRRPDAVRAEQFGADVVLAGREVRKLEDIESGRSTAVQFDAAATLKVD